MRNYLSKVIINEMCNEQFCDIWWLIFPFFFPTQTLSLSKHAPLPSTSAEHTVNSPTWCSASWFAHLTCHLLISEMPPDTHTKHTLAWQAIWKAIQGLLSSANTLSPLLWTILLISLHTDPPLYRFYVDYITNHFISQELGEEVQSLHPSISTAVSGHNLALIGQTKRA